MTQTQSSTQSGTSKQAVTAGLVKQVADKVYALWQQDVRIEQERRRQGQQGKLRRF